MTDAGGTLPAIAFVGLGAMGAPMAQNLLRAGFAVTVHNRTRHREEPLVEAGASRASSPAEAARDAEICITIVSDVPDVEEVICGPEGVLNGLRAGRLVVDMSTIGPKAARAVQHSCAQSNVRFIDAPVSGGPSGAQDASLAIMAGGAEADFQEALSALRAMGKTVALMGPVGAGQAAKLVNQVIGAGTFCAVAEGLMLARKLGLDETQTMDVIAGGAAGSWMVERLAPKMIGHDFEGGFKIELQAKDLRLVIENADELGLPMPLTRMIRQFLAAAAAEGHAQHGTQSVISVWERLSAS
ncbi:MAG: NAD(P)-dependent oxidoreductase [Armatimonadetes bacterium]|nr:NAD(P)-dependent oxidoreductase [Armatimonadota bacterium]